MLSLIQQEWLMTQYRKDPCGTLPNAYWKTMSHPADLQLDYSEGSDHKQGRMAIWQDNRLLAFRRFSPEDLPLTERQRNAALSLVHADGLAAYAGLEFSQKEAYFRIIHKGRLPDYNCASGFAFVDVNPTSEIPGVVEMIRACYSLIRVDSSSVSGWKKHPVYDPTLWVWVMDKKRDVPAGLGIAEIDRNVPEASLEWIQIHPFYRSRGLGKAIIAELLRRVSGKVDFTTVSGRVDNNTYPEQVYRQFGFTGTDVWWLLIR